MYSGVGNSTEASMVVDTIGKSEDTRPALRSELVLSAYFWCCNAPIEATIRTDKRALACNPECNQVGT